ncbi:amidohydrolase family protein [candidate division KSB1 bacterium]
MAKKINRRTFFTNAGISAAGIVFGSNLIGCSSESKSGHSSYDIMEEVKKYRKIDSHTHVHLWHGGPDVQVDFADRLGIEKLVISRPIPTDKTTPGEFRESNDMVLNSMKQYPDRLIGQCTLDPTYQKESLEEIDRCVDQGMAGLKVYIQVKINDSLYYPIIEKCIGLNWIILMHAECRLGAGGYRKKYDTGIHPNISTPDDFVDIAKRYPEAMFQYAHIGGGFDWEYACKALKAYPNVYVDTSGSNNEEHMIDFALKYLGEDRMFFGSDQSYYQGVGKILASNLTENQKRKIFFENYNNILRKTGKEVV